jgi:hypothetical protein
MREALQIDSLAQRPRYSMLWAADQVPVPGMNNLPKLTAATGLI